MNVTKTVSRLFIIKISLFAFILTSSFSPAVAQFLEPVKVENNAQQTLNLSRAILSFTNASFSKLRFDKDRDEVSRRAHKLLFEQLDPEKIFFTSEDMEAFKKVELLHDDYVIIGNLSVFKSIFTVYLQRRAEIYQYIEKYTDKDFDLDLEAPETFDTELTENLSTEDLKEHYRKFVKYSVNNQLISQSTSEEKDGDEKEEPKSLEEIKLDIRKSHLASKKTVFQFDEDFKFEMYLNAILNAFDPHTQYLTKKSLNKFRAAVSLNLVGVGARLSTHEDGGFEIGEIVAGGAAEKDKQLEKGDIIVAVGQGEQPTEMMDVTEVNIDVAVDKITGKKDTFVTLEVIKKADQSKKTISIKRAKIDLPDSAVKSLVTERDGKTIGILSVPSFYAKQFSSDKKESSSLTEDTVNLLNNELQGIDTLIIDLRYNGGGSLAEAIAFSHLFLGRKTFVRVKSVGGSVESLGSQYAPADLQNLLPDHDEPVYQGKLIVLVNKYSASASEVFAGAVQDYQRGIIVGSERTHGKATVQTLKPLYEMTDGRITDSAGSLFHKNPSVGGVKFTMQQFFQPSGRSNQKDGVVPDITLTMSKKLDESSFESSLPFAIGDASDHLEAKDTQDFTELTGYIDTLDKEGYESDIGYLKELSDNRRAESNEWDSAIQTLTRFVELNESTQIDISNNSVSLRIEEIQKLRKQSPVIPWPKEREEFGDSLLEKEVLNIIEDWSEAK